MFAQLDGHSGAGYLDHADCGRGQITSPKENNLMNNESTAAGQGAHGAQGQDKTVTIIVNGRPKEVEKEKISFEEVVLLAFPGAQLQNPDFIYTVTYTKGHNDNHEGTLTKGREVKVKDGMVFNVTETNKS